MRRYTVAIDGRTWTIDVAETTADSFEVTVDGRTFEATLTGDHDLPGVAISPQVAASDRRGAAAAPAASDPTPQVPTPADPAASPTPPMNDAPSSGQPPRRPAAGSRRAGPAVLAAPMPGVILEVHVAPGAAVRRGDPLLVLEAMKMRNTIRAPRDAVVLEVAVDVGAPVASGDPLVRFGAPAG